MIISKLQALFWGPLFDKIHRLNRVSLTSKKKKLENFREKNLIFIQILDYDVILVPKYSKITRFWPFSPKMTYFDQIEPINDIFYHIYVHKSDWNNF